MQLITGNSDKQGNPITYYKINGLYYVLGQTGYDKETFLREVIHDSEILIEDVPF